MGEYADMYTERYLSGRMGMRVAPPRQYPKTTKAAIADRAFHIVQVMPGRTNRSAGSKLVVCDNESDADSYWVWASNDVTGIRKEVCTVLEANLTLADALARTGRKPYGPKSES